jgi:hypothetical protein
MQLLSYLTDAARIAPFREMARIIWINLLANHRVAAPARKKVKIMGDRSPKSNQKKSTQKQSKASSADQKKKQAVAAKQAAGNKK